MKITSNDTVQLEKLHQDLKKDRISITATEKPVDGTAMGIELVLDIAFNIDFDLVELIQTYLEYRLIKLYLLKPSGEKEPIDVEILENKKFDKKNDTLYIEYKEK